MPVTKIDKRWGLRMIAHLASRMLTETEAAVRSPFSQATRRNTIEFLSESYLAELAEEEYYSHKQRQTFVPEHLCHDQAWYILLDLFMRESRGLATSVTSACIASGGAPTTALRYLSLIEEAGLIEIVRARHDRRVRFVSLTKAGKSAMAAYLEQRAGLRDRTTGWLMATDEPRKDLIEP